MNLSKKISNIIAYRSQALHYLLQFTRDFDAYTHQLGTQFLSDKVPANIKDEFHQLLGEFLTFWGDFLKETEDLRKKSTRVKGERQREFKPKKKYSEETHKYLFPYLEIAAKFVKYAGFLYNMVVTHTIAIFESFLTEFLVAIFTLRPNTLKSGDTATYEDILSFPSMKELRSYLASNRAEKILEGDLYDNVADKLNKTFSIDIAKFNKFNIIYEAFCRRHVIVHNDGVTDKKYCEKVPNSKIDVYLLTDLPYIETLLTTIGQFIDYLDGCFSRKMRYKRNPLANQLLHPPDSLGVSKDSS